MAEIANDDGHSVREFITEKILSKHDESSDISRYCCTYFIKITNIPDGDDVFVYCVSALLKAKTDEAYARPYRAPIFW